jgi:hypothetical protein
MDPRRLVAPDGRRRPWRVDRPAAPLFHRVVRIILPVNIALIVGIAFMDWPAKTTVGA